jgi:MFS family permease
VRNWLGERLESRVDRLTEQLGGPARRRVVVLLGLVLALNSADTAAIGAVAAQLEPGLHIGIAELGLLVTISSVVGAVATIPVGVLADKTPRVRLLSISILAWGVAEALGGLSTSFIMLALTRIALGGVTATAGPSIASLTGDLFPAGERGRIYGYIITGELIGAGVGIVGAALLSGWFGWRAAFLALAVPSIVLAWALHTYLPEPARGGQSRLEPGATEIVPADAVEAQRAEIPQAAAEPARDDAVRREVRKQGVTPDEETVVDVAGISTWGAIRYVLRVRTNLAIIVASSLGYFFFAGLRTFAVIFVRGHFGISQSLAAALTVIVGGGAVFGLLAAGRMADRLIRRGRIDARIVVGAAGYITAAALLLTPLLLRNVMLSLPLLILAAAAIAAPNPPLDAARLDVVPAQLWGRAEAVRTALRNTLEAFAPLLFGLLAEVFGAAQASFGSSTGDVRATLANAAEVRGLQVAFLVMLVPLALAGILLLAMRRHYAVDVASAGESERRAQAERMPDRRQRGATRKTG